MRKAKKSTGKTESVPSGASCGIRCFRNAPTFGTALNPDLETLTTGMARIDTDINKSLLACPFHGLAAFLLTNSQSSLHRVPQKFRSIFFANDQHWPIKAIL
jgi:hypothetical protein